MFQWQRPCLRDLDGIDAIDVAKLFVKVVSETIMRMVAKGSEAVSILSMMAVALDEEISKFLGQEGEHEPGSVLKAAVTEVHEMLVCIKALSGGSSDVDSQALDKIFSASKGARHQLRVSLNSHPFWREAEKKTRQCRVAAQTFNPEIQSTLQRLPDMAMSDIVQNVVRIPVWIDGLGAGKAQPPLLQPQQVLKRN